MALHFRLNDIEDFKNLCWNKDGGMNRITEDLIFATMTTGIPRISPAKVDEFFERLQVCHLIYGKGLMHSETKESLLTYDVIKDHTGLSTNADSLTKKQFYQKMGKALERYGADLLRYELRDQKVKASTGASVPPSVELGA